MIEYSVAPSLDIYEMAKTIQAVSNIKAERDITERFLKVRDYLDGENSDTVDRSLLAELIQDKSDLIRAEIVDFILVSGGLAYEIIESRLSEEKSDLVYPRLWLAASLLDRARSLDFLKGKDLGSMSLFEQTYYNAAMYRAAGTPNYLYSLCALACSSDLPSSFSAIDLLKIVARNKDHLFKALILDLEGAQAENANKAREVFF